MARPKKQLPTRSEMIKEIEMAQRNLKNLRKGGYGDTPVVNLLERKFQRASDGKKNKKKNFSTKQKIEENYNIAKWFNQTETSTVKGQKAVEKKRIDAMAERLGMSKQKARKLSELYSKLDNDMDFAAVEYGSGDTNTAFDDVYAAGVNLKDEDFYLYMKVLIHGEKDVSLSAEQKKVLERIEKTKRGEIKPRRK